jgi:hypothetical protein
MALVDQIVNYPLANREGNPLIYIRTSTISAAIDQGNGLCIVCANGAEYLVGASAAQIYHDMITAGRGLPL